MLSGVDSDSCTAEYKQKALREVNIIKLKRSRNLKGGMCVNGEPHHKFVLMEEAKLPTITLEILLYIMVIDSYEDRKVVTLDVPGVYLQTDLTKDKFTLLLMEGNFLDIMCDINTDYKQNVRFKYGRKTLNLYIIEAIYGIIESALLWYYIYVSVIKDMRFQLNIYYMCVVNNYINGKHCTIAWYVDNNKVSHVEQDIIYDIISKVEEGFQVLTVTKGNVHTFL